MSVDIRNSEGYLDPTPYQAFLEIEHDEHRALRAFRPIVYICSHYAGDVERNVAAARKYSRFAMERGYIPIAPHLLFPQFMDDSKPKYLNSPETIVFNKRRNLFAMNRAKKTKSEYFLLAEGYMDVIALHQAGFDSAVASLGTSLTEEQARLLSRHTKTVIVCYDADTAGQSAAQRAIDILKKTGIRVKILKIPGAKDPDEFIKTKGADAFRKLIERSDNDVRYRIEAAKDKYDFTEDDQRILFLREAAGIIALLDSEVEQDVYTTSTAKLAGVTPEAFRQEVKQAKIRLRSQAKRKMHREVRAPAQAAQPRDRSIHFDNVRSARAEEGILSLLFADTSLMEQMRRVVSPDDFSSPELPALRALRLLRCRLRR